MLFNFSLIRNVMNDLDSRLIKLAATLPGQWQTISDVLGIPVNEAIGRHKIVNQNRYSFYDTIKQKPSLKPTFLEERQRKASQQLLLFATCLSCVRKEDVVLPDDVFNLIVEFLIVPLVDLNWMVDRHTHSVESFPFQVCPSEMNKRKRSVKKRKRRRGIMQDY